MKRALCIWLPQWPLQRLAVARAELSARGVVLYRLHSVGGPRVVAYAPRLDQAAAPPAPGEPRHVIRRDMPLVEAMALAPCLDDVLPVWELYDPLADRTALENLARTCQQFSPAVSLEESEAPQSLLLDTSGLGPLWKGEERLAEAVVGELARQGLTARVAIAETRAAAWGIAHFAPLPADSHSADAKRRLAAVRVPIVAPPGETARALAPLPLAALGLDEPTCAQMASLGLERIEQLMALPRSTMLARFGATTLEKLDRATGAAAEAVQIHTAEAQLEVACDFEVPIDRREAIDAALEGLVRQLCQTLASRDQGALRIECRFGSEINRRAGDVSPLCFSGIRDQGLGIREERTSVPCDFVAAHNSFVIGFFRPSANPRHLLELIGLRCESLRLREPLTSLRLVVLASDRLEVHQQSLFADVESQTAGPRELGVLVDRLSNRLGSHRVVRPWLLEQAQPELACHDRPMASLADRPLRKKPLRRRSVRVTYARGVRSTPHPRPLSLKGRGENVYAMGTRLSLNPHRTPPSPLEGEGLGVRGRTPNQLETPTQPRATAAGDRPLHLEREPRALVVWSVAPEGPPGQIELEGKRQPLVRVWGPERIETSWWRSRCVRRDYYQVETPDGSRYWLFRELNRGSWFLHGEFV